MRSIQTRLAAGLLLSLILLLFVQWLVIAASIRQLSEQYIVARMIHASDLLVAGVAIQDDGKPNLNTARIDPIYSQPFSGYYYTVSAGNEMLRSRSLWDESLPAVTTEPGSTEVTRMKGPHSQLLLVLGSAYQKQQQLIRVVVAEDISVIESDIDQLLFQHAGLSLIVLAILISLQVYLVRRNLRPLEKIRRDLDKLETGQIDALDENVPVEIVALVRELNTRIKAVQQRLQRSRRATGNLAHALKTPLTLLLQLSEHAYLQTNQELQQALQTQISSIKNLIERELKRARVAGTSVGTKQVKLKPEIQALVKSLEAMYREKGVDIHYEVAEHCLTIMEREDLHEMLGNILDNACKWATKKIHITISCDAGLHISVEDDGEGIPQEKLDAMLIRGQRLDEQKAGYGLGLSIVKDIVDQYQGSIHMSPSQTLGGLMTVIYIPQSAMGNQ
ncbi:MAG TPA: ATP-binding protein [Gammaproteobacteria bacterium]